VKRTKYDFLVKEKWLEDTWKVPLGGGKHLEGYNPLPVVNPLSTGVAWPLYELLDSFDEVEHTDRGPAWNFWLKAKPNGNAIAGNAPRAVDYAMRSSYGVPLPAHLVRKYEPKLGVSLGTVRVHEDLAAGNAAQALNARAFTVGNDIYFGRGEYAPETRRGELLLAHEVVHVVRHTRNPSAKPPTPVAVTTAERHADALARALVEEAPRRRALATREERHGDRLARARRRAA
jgi:hypothetical protein